MSPLHALGRALVAALLATAASAKLYYLVLGYPTAYGRPFETTLVVGEAALAAWLASGVRPRAASAATGGLFCVFLAYSLWKGLSGAASCGCFAAVAISPWVMATVDAAAIALCGYLAFAGSRQYEVVRRRVWPRAVASAAAVSVLLAVVGFVASRSATAVDPAAAGSERVELAGFALHGDLAVLDPEQWPGHPLPVSDHIVSSGEAPSLSEGEWTLLFTHAGCPDCEVAKQHLAEAAAGAGGSRRFGTVEVTGLAGADGGDGEVEAFALDDRYDWFVPTPTKVFLSDGAVVSVQR